MIFPQVKTSTSLFAYLVGIVSAFAIAGTLFRLLEPLRKGGIIARFVARVWIISFFYFTLSVVMILIAGPYVFSGPRRFGGYDSEPANFKETLLGGLMIGLIGGFLWPLVTKAKGYKTEM